ncbi:hypothetical protein ACFU99_32710 [Streptomyces sp. NPDC057654]|uniref:hypothetical protein n=1 Tax=Streptomyces sp. NPDC057654 TaxID=3346196 RepID=UPI0036B711C6
MGPTAFSHTPLKLTIHTFAQSLRTALGSLRTALGAVLGSNATSCWLLAAPREGALSAAGLAAVLAGLTAVATSGGSTKGPGRRRPSQGRIDVVALFQR